MTPRWYTLPPSKNTARQGHRSLSKGKSEMTQPTFKEFYAAWIAYQEFTQQTPQVTANQKINSPRRKKKRRQDAARAGRPWTIQEKIEVVSDFKAGMTMIGLARKYGRTQKAVHDRLWHAQTGLLRHEPPPVTALWQETALAQ